MEKKVFVSYSQKDMEFVKNLKAKLEAENIGVTIDIEAAKIGDHLQDFIESAVRENEFTISVISKNSLQSVWVIAESLENFMYEKVEKRKRFLPIFIDRSVFDDDFFLEVARTVKGKIDELREKSNEAQELGVGTEHYDTKRKRLEDLKNNLSKIFHTLRERLSADFTSQEKIAENFPKLVEVIKEHLGTSGVQTTEHSDKASVSPAPQKTTTPLTSGQHRRLEGRRKDLQEAYDLCKERIRRVRNSYESETNTSVRFQLEHQIQEQEDELKKIEEELNEIEEKLGS